MSATRADPERIAFVVEALAAHRSAHGRVASDVMRTEARSLGVSERTLWRWVSAESATRKERENWKPEREDLLLYFKCRGNVAEVHRRRTTAGLPTPGARQLLRAFNTALTPAERAYARDGEEGFRRYSVYLRVEQAHRNELWQADHVELPVYVSVPRRTGWFKAWGTFFIDAFSRAITGYAVSLQPTAAEVLAGVRSAIVVDPERGPFGGVPDMILWDNGTEFLSGDVTAAMADLGCYCAPAQAYAPHQKGKIERLFRTMETEFLSSLPYYTHGPKAANGKLYGPSSGPIGLEELVARVDAYVHTYNTERFHSAIGMTPVEKWEQDPSPLQLIDEEKLRWMLLGKQMRKIRKDGVFWEAHLFFATELQGLVGEEVEIRYMPHDARQIWIYRDGEFLCRAVQHKDLPEELRRAHLGHRSAQKKAAQSLRRETSRRERSRQYRRGRIEPMTGPGEVVDTVPPAAPSSKRPRARKVSDETLAILGITDVNAPLDEDGEN